MTDRDDVADRVRDVLERIADAAGADVDVDVYDEGETLVGEYVGDDVARLIGHRGQTIDAIQHLTYRIAGQGDDERVSVIVDADGYREQRAVALRQSADQAVAAALRDGRPIEMEAMSALERKVVHEHLKDRHDIETYSRGQEPSRRLVVAPIVES